MFDFNSVKVDNDGGQKIYDEILYRKEIEKLQKYFPHDKFYIKDHKIICNGGLTIDSTIPLEKLPDDLHVNYLDIYSSKLKYIPENIKYFAYLNISFCNNIKKLPDDLVISDILNISFSSIRKLPNNLHALGYCI